MPTTNFFATKTRREIDSSTPTYIVARVRDVILDSTHPNYEDLGKDQSIGVIKYAALEQSLATENPEPLPIAFPLNLTVREYPLINEVVLIQRATSEENSDSVKKDYYSTVVSLFQHPNNNAYPLDSKLGLGKDIPSLKNLSRLHPFPGDFILQGRLGQSIRFTGYKHPKNLFTNDSNNANPIIKIVNGQFETEDSTQTTVEDINKDGSSIYFLSNHLSSLEQVRDKSKASKVEPVKSNNYKGNQVLVNSGRIFLNAKEEDVLVASNESFGVTSKDVHLDGEDYISLDALKIYLGERAKLFEGEPVIKGDSLEYFLEALIKQLERLAKKLTKANAMGKPIPLLNKEGPVMQAKMKNLLSRINPGGKISDLKSKKTFTE